MKKIVCEMCGGNDLIKQEGVFVCQHCGVKYSLEEAKRMLIEGTVSVEGTVKIDNSAFVENCLVNARRAYAKEDWEEVERYYNMVEQNAPHNMEAVFFSAYGKAMLSMTDSDYFKREQKFSVLAKSIAIISDCYEVTNEDKRAVLTKISDAIMNMYRATFVCDSQAADGQMGSNQWQRKLNVYIRTAFITELEKIAKKHNDAYIQELIAKMSDFLAATDIGWCYVATAVYGTYDCPQVWTLRRFRDNALAKTWCGRAFIHLYYAISPTLVKWFGETKWFKKMWRGMLDRMVRRLQNRGYESTPYVDREWR